MKYFLDTEFIERFHKPLFGKPRHVIDLISIGIVSEDGHTYYAISNEYNYNDASDWVKENVLDLLYIYTVHGDQRNRYNSDNFHKAYGKSNRQISLEIIQFIIDTATDDDLINNSNIEFYGYYADYDWVLFCSLFGSMINLPKGFPMYCKDLKQMLDALADKTNQLEINYLFYNSDFKLMDEKMPNSTKDISDWTLTQKLTFIKSHKAYPKQTNEHHALADAQWNKELFYFISTF